MPPNRGRLGPFRFSQQNFERQNNIAPYDPKFQADQDQFAAERAGIAARSEPFTDVIQGLRSSNAPSQVRNTPYTVILTAPFVPKMIIPANPNRVSWLLTSRVFQNTMEWTYNFPVGNIGVAMIGNALPAGGVFQENGGSVSVDEIWVFVTDSTSLPQTVLAYEGVLSVSSSNNNQTRTGSSQQA